MSRNKINQQLFSAHAHALAEKGLCPQCQSPLQLRHGKHGSFLGCSSYPDCDYIQPLHQNDGHIVKSLGVNCSECGHELVLRQGRYGMFIGCSNYPECEHTEPFESHEQKPQKRLICPECHEGTLVERKSRFGKVFWACDCYPKCKFAVNSQPLEGVCSQCGFQLLVEKKTASGVKKICASKKCGYEEDGHGT
ncbi:DNA topoisomerase family protein [Vibrio quintilis]|uniref:DNA topoisomerase 1 n=1 Tax=Vibrio quintilis TaxID=1117707 RepID=A0A1M7YP93_9VIBR|nr:type I DNA topoisomerase [Vibrio quintilis]SHO54296.1 DNA topoisomerase 1 [Vibrio quintilis]